MNSTKKQVNNVWDNYWRSGAEASFLNKNTSLQRYQMRKFWFERMSEFEAKSPIVDIGCGNGILIGWLNEYKNEKNKSKWQLIGVDSAALRPTNPELDVRELTPYQSFKLTGNKKLGTVVSHYGLEYGPLIEGLTHLHTQLKKDGALVALVHSSNSTLVRNNKAMYELMPSLIRHLEKNVYNLYTSILEARGKPLGKQAALSQRKLDQLAHTHRNNPTFKRSNFVPAVRHILQAASNGKKLEARQVYNDFLNNMKFHYAQMDDMIQAVEQVKSADHLAQAAEKAGFKRVMVQDVEFPETGEVGFCLQAIK